MFQMVQIFERNKHDLLERLLGSLLQLKLSEVPLHFALFQIEFCRIFYEQTLEMTNKILKSY